MGVFDKKKEILRSDFRSALRKLPPKSSRVGGRKYERRERIDFEKKLFPAKYGGRISKQEYNTILRKLSLSKSGKSTRERTEIQRKIDFLKRLGK